MKRLLTRLTIPTAGCLALMLATGCGDSLANGTPVDAEKAFSLSKAEAQTLTTHIWKRQSTERHTSFLEIDQDRTGGFRCNNDGKSVSGRFSFLRIDGEIVMTSPAGHGQGPDVVESLRFQGEDLLIGGSEKGIAYTETYIPIPELPTICQRLKAGEEPTFEEYEASWDPEQ